MKKERFYFNPKRFYLSSTITILTALAILPMGVTAEENIEDSKEEKVIDEFFNEEMKETKIESEEKFDEPVNIESEKEADLNQDKEADLNQNIQSTSGLAQIVTKEEPVNNDKTNKNEGENINDVNLDDIDSEKHLENRQLHLKLLMRI